MKRFIVLIAFLYGFNVNANPNISELSSYSSYSSSIYPFQSSSGLSSSSTGAISGSPFVSSAAPFVGSLNLGLKLLNLPFSIFHKSKPLVINIDNNDLDVDED